MFRRKIAKEAEYPAQLTEYTSDIYEPVSDPDLLSRIKAAGPREFQASEPVFDKILKKIHHEDAVPGTGMPVKRKRPFRLALGLSLGLLAALISYHPFITKKAIRVSPNKSTIIQEAIAAVRQPGKITYYKVTGGHSDKNAEGQWQEEHWIDHENKVSKSIFRNIRDSEGPSVITYVKNGRNINVEEYKGLVEVFESDSAGIDQLKETARNYRELLERGKAKVVGEEEVDGILTYKLKVVEEQSIMRADKSKELFIQTVNLKKKDYRPVRITTERVIIHNNKPSEKESSETMLFSEVKLIEKMDLAGGFFDLDLPEGAGYHISRTMDLKEAKSFKKFDLYYLGESFAGFKFDGYIESYNDLKLSRRDSGYGKGEPPYVPQDNATMYYHNQNYSEGIALYITPINHPFAKDPVIPNDSTKETIYIGNKAAILISVEQKYSRGYQLLIPMGNASVKIEGNKKDTVLKAAGALIKIN